MVFVIGFLVFFRMKGHVTFLETGRGETVEKVDFGGKRKLGESKDGVNCPSTLRRPTTANPSPSSSTASAAVERSREAIH